MEFYKQEGEAVKIGKNKEAKAHQNSFLSAIFPDFYQVVWRS